MIKEFITIATVSDDYDVKNSGREELIRCKDCKHHRNRTGRCDVWSANTPADGHCYRAKRHEER